MHAKNYIFFFLVLLVSALVLLPGSSCQFQLPDLDPDPEPNTFLVLRETKDQDQTLEAALMEFQLSTPNTTVLDPDNPGASSYTALLNDTPYPALLLFNGSTHLRTIPCTVESLKEYQHGNP